MDFGCLNNGALVANFAWMGYWFLNACMAIAKTKNTINPSSEKNLEVFSGIEGISFKNQNAFVDFNDICTVSM